MDVYRMHWYIEILVWWNRIDLMYTSGVYLRTRYYSWFCVECEGWERGCRLKNIFLITTCVAVLQSVSSEDTCMHELSPWHYNEYPGDQVNGRGARRFLSCYWPRFEQEYLANDPSTVHAHWYEVIEAETPVRLYFDMVCTCMYIRRNNCCLWPIMVTPS